MAIDEMRYDDRDLERLKAVLQGLDSFNLALVWHFAEHLLMLQTRIEEHEKAKAN